MNIGQIVFIKDPNRTVQTGIIISKEYENDDTTTWWYEVLCDDNKNHILPEFVLSPAQLRPHRGVAYAT